MPRHEGTRPVNAGWTAKAVMSLAGDGVYVPPEGQPGTSVETVEVAWCDSGRIKLTLRDGVPAVLRQVYLAGKRDVTIKVAPGEEAA